jgi:hypothetical protein
VRQWAADPNEECHVAERNDESRPGETRTTVQAEEQRRREVERHQAEHPEDFTARTRETDEAREEAAGDR